jgi:hypothetical protein
MPDPNPQQPNPQDPNPHEIDVAKLYELYKDAEQHGPIGRKVLRAAIIDVLQSKLSGDAPIFWALRLHAGPSHVAGVLHELIDKVSLTEEERRILDELKKEDEDGQGGE